MPLDMGGFYPVGRAAWEGWVAGDPVSRKEAEKHFAVCEQIMLVRPRWLVMWGPVTRRYWASPLFWTPSWLWAACDLDPYALIARMDEVERVFRPGR
jgi:hypothetical protein